MAVPTATFSPNHEARIAAIQSLERLRQESEAYHWPVVELLCAYVRLNSVRANEKREEDASPMEDVAAAIGVVAFRREVAREQAIHRMDLSRARLTRAYLAKITKDNQIGGNFNGAYLWYAELRHADLRSNTFKGAQLQGAKLGFALLDGADFQAARFHQDALNEDSCDLSDADLRRVKNLTYEQIQFARGNGATKLPSGLRRPESWVQT